MNPRQSSRGTLGSGTDDERLRTLEMFVGNHEDDLTAFSDDMRDIKNDMKEFRAESSTEFRAIRTSISTLTIAVMSASLTFAGAAAAIMAFLR